MLSGRARGGLRPRGRPRWTPGLGAVHGPMAALPHLRAHGGALVIVSSEIAERAFPLAAAYSATEHGLNAFVEALRTELRHEHAPVSPTEVQRAAIATSDSLFAARPRHGRDRPARWRSRRYTL